MSKAELKELFKELDDSFENTKSIIKKFERAIKEEENEEPALMNFEQTLKFLNMKPGSLYKLTQRNLIPFYKPTGSKLYFKKDELLKYVESKRKKTEAETEEDAIILLADTLNI